MKIPFMITLFLFSGGSLAESAPPHDESCTADESLRRMPGIILDYLRAKNAAEQQSLPAIRQAAVDILAKASKFSTPYDQEAEYSNIIDCNAIAAHFRAIGYKLARASSISEALDSISIVEHLIAQWGYLAQMNLDQPKTRTIGLR